jgi:hypothetical protein
MVPLMRISPIVLMFFVIGCGRTDAPGVPGGGEPGGGGEVGTPALPDPAVAVEPTPGGALTLEPGMWKARGTQVLTNTCGIQQAAMSEKTWTIKAMGADQVKLYPGDTPAVALQKMAARWVGDVVEVVPVHVNCQIRDSMRFDLEPTAAGQAEGTLREQLTVEKGDCTGVMSLPCEIEQGLSLERAAPAM